MTNRSKKREERNEEVLDRAAEMREATAVTERNRLLTDLKQTKNYREAITRATQHPDALWSFPLLMAALTLARNAEQGSRNKDGHVTMSGRGPDYNAIFPALSNIMNQPYAKTILDEVTTWAPRQVLEHAGSFANRPFAVDVIIRAMKTALDKAEASPNNSELPVECMFAMYDLSDVQALRQAITIPALATQLVRYKTIHDQHHDIYGDYPAAPNVEATYDLLKDLFEKAKATLAAPRAPIPTPPILVLSSPSGGGKSTQRRNLIKENPNREFLVSYTTRPPRPDEVDGIDYHFLSIGRTPAEAKAEFERLVKEGDILFETTSFNGNRYGTPRKQLEEGLASGKQLEEGLANGKQLIADVNLNGVKALRAAYPHQVQALFLHTELDELRRRLHKRDIAPYKLTDEQLEDIKATVDARMRVAASILAEAKATINDSPAYDAVVPSASTPEATFANVKQALAETAPKTTINTGELQGVLKYISQKHKKEHARRAA